MQRIFCDKCGNDITDEYAKVDIEVGPFLRAVEKKQFCEPCLLSFAALLNSFIQNFITLPNKVFVISEVDNAETK